MQQFVSHGSYGSDFGIVGIEVKRPFQRFILLPSPPPPPCSIALKLWPNLQKRVGTHKF